MTQSKRGDKKIHASPLLMEVLINNQNNNSKNNKKSSKVKVNVLLINSL